MINDKHTPGPWTQDTSHSNEREGITIWSNDVIIADVVPDQHGQHEANAALIARAPLLIECREVLSELTASIDSFKAALEEFGLPVRLSPRMIDAYDDARALLEKLNGE